LSSLALFVDMPSKPDIGVFGRYTYLLTEIFWGAIAYLLLRRMNAVGRTAKTVLVLYPVAYAWDWYTLAVGVFDIRLRTGIDLAGIPLEEHLFAVVVPSLVIGFHENVHGGSAGSGPRTDTEEDREAVEDGTAGDATRF
jgi:lycopene cyclase domain-containing protein